MPLIALESVNHAGRIYPEGSTLPDDVDAERLIANGAAKEKAEKRTPRRSPRKREKPSE